MQKVKTANRQFFSHKSLMIFLLRRLWHTRRLKDHQDIPAFKRKMIEEFAEGVHRRRKSATQ